MLNIKVWDFLTLNKDAAVSLAGEKNLSAFLATLLTARENARPGFIDEIVGPPPQLCAPFLLPDMNKAATRIRQAVDEFEKIAIYGDYDADGVTATAVLYNYLTTCGADVMYYIPDRDLEGYGLNEAAVRQLHEQGVRLIVTVDNGIASVNETRLAAQLGMEVVITDHHRPQGQLPAAFAVVDPYREDCTAPFKDYSGAGVAFKLVEAMEEGFSSGEELLEDYADLVCLGTVGDVVSLTGENRLLVQQGLQVLQAAQRPGIAALLENCSMAGRKLTAANIAFTLVPRINAAGRMGSGDSAVQLLICEDPEQAQLLAKDICEANDLRKKTENEIMESVLAILQNSPQLCHDRVLVLDGENWHHGVIGIVAARLTEKLGRPCIVLSRCGDTAKGSGRSVEGFSLFEAVRACACYMQKYGGHPMAAGLTMASGDIPAFREKINEYARQTCDLMPGAHLRIDCKLNPAALQLAMPAQAARLEPFGTDNPEPVYALMGMTIAEIVPVGGGNHLRLVCSRGGARVNCMRFFTTAAQFAYAVGDKVDLAVSLDVKEYRGEASLSVVVRDMRPAGADSAAQLASWRIYEKYLRGEPIAPGQAEQLLPAREDFARLYRLLKTAGGWNKSPLLLCACLDGMPVAKLLLSLQILQERGLVGFTQEQQLCTVQVLAAEKKVDLFASPLYAQACKQTQG